MDHADLLFGIADAHDANERPYVGNRTALMRIEDLYPISYERFTVEQKRIWDLKLQGRSLREISAILVEEGITTVPLWPCPITNSLRRTALGHRWTQHTSHGPHGFLNMDELRELVLFVDRSCEGVSLTEICDEAINIRERNRVSISESLFLMSCPGIASDIDNIASVTRSWALKTCRAESLHVVSPELLEADRWLYATTAVVNRWFDTMTPYALATPGPLCFNFDESMVLVSSAGKVVVHHDRKVFKRKWGKQKHFTIGMCVSPSGVEPPPLIILPEFAGYRNTFAPLIDEGNCMMDSSPSGWINGAIFRKWGQFFVDWLRLRRRQLPAHLRDKPAILYLDNHTSHMDLETLVYFATNNIVAISLPPHLTHVLQPVDVAVAKAFKSSFRQAFHHLETGTRPPGQDWTNPTSKHRSLMVLACISGFKQAATLETCTNGFRRAGLFPWDREVPLRSSYVTDSGRDAETDKRLEKPEMFHSGSSILTSDAFIDMLKDHEARISAEKAAKAAKKNAQKKSASRKTISIQERKILVDHEEQYRAADKGQKQVILTQVARDLHILDEYWDTRQVRLWYNNSKSRQKKT